MEECFFTVEYNGELLDAEYNSSAQAKEAIDTIYTESCMELGLDYGSVMEEKCNIVKFVYDEDTGETTILDSEPYWLEYEETAPDYIEHGTW